MFATLLRCHTFYPDCSASDYFLFLPSGYENRVSISFLLLSIQVTQAQYTIELTHWEYTNGLNSKQKRQATVLENYDAGGNWIKQKVCKRKSGISPWTWVGEFRKVKLK